MLAKNATQNLYDKKVNNVRQNTTTNMYDKKVNNVSQKRYTKLVWQEGKQF
jgi:hypothetical protein